MCDLDDTPAFIFLISHKKNVVSPHKTHLVRWFLQDHNTYFYVEI